MGRGSWVAPRGCLFAWLEAGSPSDQRLRRRCLRGRPTGDRHLRGGPLLLLLSVPIALYLPLFLVLNALHFPFPYSLSLMILPFSTLSLVPVLISHLSSTISLVRSSLLTCFHPHRPSPVLHLRPHPLRPSRIPHLCPQRERERGIGREREG